MEEGEVDSMAVGATTMEGKLHSVTKDSTARLFGEGGGEDLDAESTIKASVKVT